MEGAVTCGSVRTPWGPSSADLALLVMWKMVTSTASSLTPVQLASTIARRKNTAIIMQLESSTAL